MLDAVFEHSDAGPVPRRRAPVASGCFGRLSVAPSSTSSAFAWGEPGIYAVISAHTRLVASLKIVQKIFTKFQFSQVQPICACSQDHGPESWRGFKSGLGAGWLQSGGRPAPSVKCGTSYMTPHRKEAKKDPMRGTVEEHKVYVSYDGSENRLLLLLLLLLTKAH